MRESSYDIGVLLDWNRGAGVKLFYLVSGLIWRAVASSFGGDDTLCFILCLTIEHSRCDAVLIYLAIEPSLPVQHQFRFVICISYAVLVYGLAISWRLSSFLASLVKF
jgi:hypothetical protein